MSRIDDPLRAGLPVTQRLKPAWQRVTAALIGGFAVGGLLLAAMGLFGVVGVHATPASSSATNRSPSGQGP